MSQRIRNVAAQVLFMLICTMLVIRIASVEQRTEQTGEKYERQTLEVWYGTSVYQPYLAAAAEQFEQEMQKKGTPVDISFIQMPALEYTASIEQGIKNGKGPDVYLTDTSSLQNFIRIRAAAKTEETDTYRMDQFSSRVWENMEYQGNDYGYPLGFDTVAFMYHKESSPENKLPDSLWTLCEEVGLEEKTEHILDWDRSNFLVNYSFLAAYINAGGENGDQAEINVDNEKVMESARLYQQFGTYFPEEGKTTKEVIEEVRSGSLKYAIVTTDALTMDEKTMESTGFMKLPDWNGQLKTSPVAITDLLMVNPSSGRKEMAEEFARYCSLTAADQMYANCGVLPLAKTGNLPKDSNVFYESYEEAVSLPKIMTLTDYWSRIRDAMIKIKNGADVESFLHELQEQFEIQIKE